MKIAQKLGLAAALVAALGFVPASAQLAAQPDAAVQRAAAAQKQPLLDTLKEFVSIETGSRDMRLINGMWKYLPHTAVLAIVASLAMAGVPLLNGFLSKEMFFGETLSQNLLGSFNWLVPAVATLAGVFSVAYSLRFIHDVFFNGEPASETAFPNSLRPADPPRFSVARGAFCFVDDPFCRTSLILTADVGIGTNLFGGRSPDLPYAQFNFRGGFVLKPLTIGQPKDAWHPWGIGLVGSWSRGTGSPAGGFGMLRWFATTGR